jgi:NTE family protein
MHSLPRRLGIESDYKTVDLSKDVDIARIVQDFSLPNRFGIDLVCFSYKPQDDSYAKRMIDVLSYLINDYHYIILDLPSYMDKPMFTILNQSDIINILTSPEPIDLQKTHKLIERLKTEFEFKESKIKVVINEYKRSRISYEQQKDLLKYDISATLPKIEFLSSDRLILDMPECEYARAIKRISRTFGERLVGLALGVGAAYGFCHIGVLKVIEEEKIPVDVIAGSSIGAIIAALWAVGKSSQEILEIAREFEEPKYIWSIVDLTFPRMGFIKGDKLYRFLKKHLGNKTFYEVRLPLKIIASDVKRKAPRVLDNGLLVDAVMASCSMPGVFAPFRSKEDILLDGGIINPLPTEILFKMGARKIIAVSVTPTREDILKQYEKIEKKDSVTEAGRKLKKRFSLRRYFRERFKTNILDIIFSSIELMQSEVAQKEAQSADVVLHPDTSGLYWLDLHKAEEFARRGEEEARRKLGMVWQIINE